MTGPRNPRWLPSGVSQKSSGYVRVRVGIGHQLADRTGFAYLHAIIYFSSLSAEDFERAFDRYKSGEFVLHHKNEDKSDNRTENLAFVSRAQHQADHRRTDLMLYHLRHQQKQCDGGGGVKCAGIS